MAYSTSLYPLARKTIAQGYYGDATSPGAPGTMLSQWGYVTADTAATVETAGYFNAANGGAVVNVVKGDIIDAVMNIGGTPVMKSYIVTAAGPSSVTIALQSTTAG